SVNHAVSADHLAWVVWGDAPPPTGRATLQSYVSRLRHQLGPDAVISEDHSYILEAECRQLDCCRFEQMVHQAQEVLASAPNDARLICRSAIDLWRGPALGELGDEEWARLEAIRLEELKLLAVEIETESELRLGRCGECASRLRGLVIEYPYRERFWQQLVYALFNSGRRLESMTAFDEYQKWMAESGLEPEANFDELVAGSSFG
ncbi:MAG: SARP family transcriptional regulator, partial [Acidimicrobiia bacterium]|nr:SARP family transcriptional regulator [Acidimicrobiia bacterium]